MLSVVNVDLLRTVETLRLPSAAALASKDWQNVRDAVYVHTHDVLESGGPDGTSVALLHFKSAQRIFQADDRWEYLTKSYVHVQKSGFHSTVQYSTINSFLWFILSMIVSNFFSSHSVPGFGPVLASRVLSLSAGQPNANRSRSQAKVEVGVKVMLERDRRVDDGEPEGSSLACVHWSNALNNWQV